jgi:hypothetical protein
VFDEQHKFGIGICVHDVQGRFIKEKPCDMTGTFINKSGSYCFRPCTMGVLKSISTQQTTCNEAVEHELAGEGVENFQHG